MKSSSSGLVEGLPIRLIGDATCPQDLFQGWSLHFGVIRDGDKLSGGTGQHYVLAVPPAFESEFTFQDFPVLLPGSQRQFRKGHELRPDLETRADPFTARFELEPGEIAIPGLTDAHLHFADAAVVKE